MALVVGLERVDGNRAQLHRTNVTAKYRTVTEGGQTTVIQIDTYGSAEREFPGKLSQTVQFDRKSAEQLWVVLGREFGFDSK